MTLLEHANTEMDFLGLHSPDGDDINDWAREAILDLLETLSKHGPSGASVNFIVNTFAKLAKFEPLCPLTGVDTEWMDVTERPNGDVIYQNIRCSHVFKDGKDGKAYDIDGRIFIDQNGAAFTSYYYDSEHPERSSKVYIEFPYTPKSEFVKVFYDYDTEDGDFVILEDQS
jgi:hypothetical protein